MEREMVQEKHELAIYSFLDSAVSLIPTEQREKRLNRMVVQFYYLGVIDSLRQSEALSIRDFHILIARTFQRYGISIRMPVPLYISKVAEHIQSTLWLERAMQIGAEAFRSFWSHHDTSAPLILAKLIAVIDDSNNEYERFPGRPPFSFQQAPISHPPAP
jgi:hypothetical protein